MCTDRGEICARGKASKPRWSGTAQHKPIRVEVTSHEGQTWWLLTTTDKGKANEQYDKRFRIEKLFQEHKSGGFDLEKTKIRKDDRFRRLFYCLALAHLLMVFVGGLVESTSQQLKKTIRCMGQASQPF